MSRQPGNIAAIEPPIVEACVDSLESAWVARAAGADRLELCASLDVGGTTPPMDLVTACVQGAALPVHVMVRPRGGGFVYDASELARMRRDVEDARSAGASALVLGILGAMGRVDVARTRELVECARPLPVTFHRAFDAAPDLDQALDALLAAGVSRVLTSGGAAKAEEGVARLAALVKSAGAALEVMAGGGVRAPNVRRIVAETGVRSVHARCDRAESDAFARMVAAVRLGSDASRSWPNRSAPVDGAVGSAADGRDAQEPGPDQGGPDPRAPGVLDECALARAQPAAGQILPGLAVGVVRLADGQDGIEGICRDHCQERIEERARRQEPRAGHVIGPGILCLVLPDLSSQPLDLRRQQQFAGRQVRVGPDSCGRAGREEGVVERDSAFRRWPVPVIADEPGDDDLELHGNHAILEQVERRPAASGEHIPRIQRHVSLPSRPGWPRHSH